MFTKIFFRHQKFKLFWKWAGPLLSKFSLFKQKSGPAHFQNILNLKKLKKWKIGHKEARKQNSDQYKFSRMIIESAEAFRIKIMNDSKNSIHIFLKSWIGNGSAQGRPWFGSENEKVKNSHKEARKRNSKAQKCFESYLPTVS